MSVDILTNNYLESLSYTEEDIEALVEQIISEGITVDAIKKKYLMMMDKGEKLLRDNDISVKAIKAQGKKIGADFKKQYEEGKTPKDVSKMIIGRVTELVTSFAKPYIKKMAAAGEATSTFNTPQKVGIAIVMFIAVLIVQSCIMVPLIVITGPQVGIAIAAIILAPITEEALKAYYIANGMPWIGTGVTFGIEMINYIVVMTMSGASLPAAIIARLIGLAVHFTTTWIQKQIYDRAPTKFDQNNYMFAAWVSGVAIHMMWNSFALVYNKEIQALLK